MKSSILLAASIIAAALFTACSSQEKTDANDAPSLQTVSVSFDAINYQVSHELTGSADDYFRDADIVYTDSVSLVLPMKMADNDLATLRDSIISLAFDTTGTDIDKIISDYVSRDAKQFSFPTKQVAPVDIYSADGFEMIAGSVVNYNPSLLVYEVANSSYSPGAAHGITSRFYINYDLIGDRLLNGKFMFAEAKRGELAKAIAARANEMTEIIGPTEIDSLPDRDNFYINPEGEIVFVFQPYEVASYAQGLISINLYPAELADYLTPEAQKYFHLDDLND